MTVAELIAKLEQCDPESLVVHRYEYWYIGATIEDEVWDFKEENGTVVLW
jgi:hypothetical protein